MRCRGNGFPKHRFLLGFVTGVTFWAGVNYWIQFVIAVHGGLGTVGGTVVWVLFCLAKGFIWAFSELLAGVLIQKRYAVIAIPALWAGIERIPGPFFYTWLTLGNAGIDMALPMRLAPFTGVYGLSFVFALFGTAIAWIALRRPRKRLSGLASYCCAGGFAAAARADQAGPGPRSPCSRTLKNATTGRRPRPSNSTRSSKCCRCNRACPSPARLRSLAGVAGAGLLLRGHRPSRSAAQSCAIRACSD